MAEACERHGWRLHAYAIMPNHYHLALETPEPNLVEGMHWLQSTFATRFNRFRNERGHLFQVRYQSPLVEDPAALARVIDYIHVNPARAGRVPAAACASFRWGSLRKLMRPDRPAWMCVDALLEQRRFADSSAGWLNYIGQLAALAVSTADRVQNEFTELCTGWAIGTDGWKRAVAQEHRHLALAPGYAADQLRDIKTQHWRERLEYLLQRAGKLPQDAASDPSYAPWKIEAAAALRRECVPYAWIRESLAMGGLSSIRGFVFRSEHRTA